ncbi:uncharacterized protein LOC123536953 [Mercenaria mercenaria]|uniref:uncharacterized protein LOC123536953 n=1 Tax=Mercenaria mercenaria TaxID=6596 RepID=UPI00234E986F|nr:uncharacterized protein LOC123536953 [Mercenaria mercenaria]
MEGYFVFEVVSAFLAITVITKKGCYGSACNDINIAAGGSLPSGSYSIVNNKGGSFRVYCQFYSGYGYTFISNTTAVDVDMALLMDDTSHVIVRHKRLDGQQYTSTIKQLDSFSSVPISIQFNGHAGYTTLLNTQLAPYIYVGFIPTSLSNKGDTQGWKINNDPLTFNNCDGNPNSYFAFLFNHNNVGYTNTASGHSSLLFSWYSSATQIPQLEYLPDEFFTSYYEIHHGGCGGFGTADGIADVTGATVGVKFPLTCGPPADIGYGTKSYADISIGSAVLYSCNENYTMISGDATRTCTVNGSWSGTLPACKELVNVAIGKTAYQTDTYCCGSGDADLAVDGGVSQYWHDGSCSLTESKADTYWEVDLGDLYIIDHVTILARIDPCCDSKLRQVELYTGTAKTFFKRVSYYDGVITNTHTFHMDHTTHARWVKITRVSSVDEQLSLCEVQVMGYKPASLLYKQKANEIGNGTALSVSSSWSQMDCCRKCFRYPGCLAVNLFLNTSMCYLLDSDSYTSNEDQNIVFFSANYNFV